MMENKNTPAIPCTIEYNSKIEHPGLTKREYAAIHCNEPIPAWFKPEFSKEPKHVLNMAHTFGPVSDHPHKEYFKYFIDGKWLPTGILEGTTQAIPEIPQSLKIQVKNHLIRMRKYHRKLDKWKKDYQAAQLKQWRYYFADNLL